MAVFRSAKYFLGCLLVVLIGCDSNDFEHGPDAGLPGTILLTPSQATDSENNATRKNYGVVRGVQLCVLESGTVLHSGSVGVPAANHNATDYYDNDATLRRKTKNGTWSDVAFPFGQSDLNLSSISMVENAKGRVFGFVRAYNSNRSFNSVRVAYSADEGITWHNPDDNNKIETFTDAKNILPLIDLEKVTNSAENYIRTITPIGGGVIKQLPPHAGRLIASFHVTSRRPGASSSRSTSFVLYSDDGGVTWKTSEGLPYFDYGYDGATRSGRGPTEPAVFERSDGSLAMVVRRTRTETPVKGISISKDGGETWSFPEPNRWLVDSRHHVHSNAVPLTGLNEGKPRLVATRLKTRSHSRNAPGNGLKVMLSYNEGRTFEHINSIWSGPTGYNQVRKLTRDTAIVAYERGRHDYKEEVALVRIPLSFLKQ